MITRCTPIANTKGAKLGNIILEGSTFIVCPTCSLYMSFIYVGPMIKSNIFQYTRLYMELVEAKILFYQRFRGTDSWFSYRKVESWATIDPSYSSTGSFMGPANGTIVVGLDAWVQLPRQTQTLSHCGALY